MFHWLELRLRFEDTKRIIPPEMRPKSFGTLGKQAPDPNERVDENTKQGFPDKIAAI